MSSIYLSNRCIGKTILVTGGAGFIGSHLVDKLLELGNRVIVVDNHVRWENMTHVANNPNYAFYPFDVSDEERLNGIFADNKPEIVFHLAANSDISKSFDNPNIDFENTFLTTYNLLNVMKEHNVKNIVFASTSAVYGNLKGELSENSAPLLPVSHYGASKLASEAFISSFVENYGMQAWILRFPNVVGPRATHGIVYDFIHKLRENPYTLEVLGDGNQYKPYLYVSDLVHAILFTYSNSNEKINLFNIGNNTRTYVKDIALMSVEEMDLKDITKIVYTGGKLGWVGDVAQFDYCLDKIHALGWKSTMTSDEAIREALKCNL